MDYTYDMATGRQTGSSRQGKPLGGVVPPVELRLSYLPDNVPKQENVNSSTSNLTLEGRLAMYKTAVGIKLACHIHNMRSNSVIQYRAITSDDAICH